MIERQKCPDSDPWPVTKLRKDTVLEAAQILVRARNTELVNECSNAITLLPASGAITNVQGGSLERRLYSLRSPTIEPFKVHLWQVPAVRIWNETKGSWNVIAGKIMVRRGLRSEPFTHLLITLGVTKDKATIGDLCKHFRCWRLLNAHDGWLNEYPRNLREVVYQRWWSFNGFRFLELPPELREMILIFAMGPVAIPFSWYPRSVAPNMALSLVSMQLNREVIAALCAHTTFLFHSIGQFLKFFRHRDWNPRAKFPSSEGLRSVELDLGPNELLDIWALLKDKFALCHRVRIQMHHVFNDTYIPFPCQKVYSLAVWAAARAHLRDIATIELVGHIDETQKQEWLAEHALERKGIIPEANDFEAWQKGIWTQW